MRLFLKSWLPVAVWALLIYGSSTASFGTPETSRIVVPILHWLLPEASSHSLELFHEFVRKCAHFGNYFVFSLLLFRAIRGQNKGWLLRWALLAVLVAGSYACADEYHQSFEAGRGPSAADALLDTTGAASAQVLVWAFLGRREQSLPPQQVRG